MEVFFSVVLCAIFISSFFCASLSLTLYFNSPQSHSTHVKLAGEVEARSYIVCLLTRLSLSHNFCFNVHTSTLL